MSRHPFNSDADFIAATKSDEPFEPISPAEPCVNPGLSALGFLDYHLLTLVRRAVREEVAKELRLIREHFNEVLLTPKPKSLGIRVEDKDS